MVSLPDGTMKPEKEMTADDYQAQLEKIYEDYKDVIEEKPDEEEVKKIANKNSRKRTKG